MLFLGEVILKSFRIFKCKVYFSTNCASLFFSSSFTASSIVAMISLLGSVFRSNWEVKTPCEKIWEWFKCPENIWITHFILHVMLIVISYFVLADSSSNFCICLLFVKTKNFLYKFLMNLFCKIRLLRCYRF